MKADPDQIYHHEGQRGEPPQKQAIHNQQELAFSRSTSTEPRRSIYSVKTWDYTAPTSWTEGSLLFTNKEDRPATKMDYRLTAEVTESTPWATPRDCSPVGDQATDTHAVTPAKRRSLRDT